MRFAARETGEAMICGGFILRPGGEEKTFEVKVRFRIDIHGNYDCPREGTRLNVQCQHGASLHRKQVRFWCEAPFHFRPPKRTVKNRAWLRSLR
jgi:hypothetical protein